MARVITPRARTIRRSGRSPATRPRLASSRLEAMIEEATIDAYTESEQAGGFYAKIEEALDLPFEAKVLDLMVSVRRMDITEKNEVVAVCYRGRRRQAIPILALPVPAPSPAGWEWIEAYRRWARGRS